jgi:putative ABC transport system permease protein
VSEVQDLQMTAMRRFFRRLTWWTTSARAEEILRAEIEDHIAMQTADNLRAGMTAIEARRQALLKFGNVDAIKEIYRDQRGLPFMETLLRDTRHALRRLRRTPAFTVAVLLTLALGIGANTAIFGVIDTILIRPLAYPHAEALVGVWHTAPGLPAFGGISSCSPSMYFTYREQNRTFQQFGLWSSAGASVTRVAEPEMLRALFVTYGVLDALEEKPLLGRWFSLGDDAPGSPETVILTYGYWQSRFNGDRSILGRAMTINSTPHTVIGVMPEQFRFQRDPDLILPQRFDRNAVSLGDLGYRGIARLKPGVTITQANADLARMLEIWSHAWPLPPGFDAAVIRDARFGPKIQPLKQEILGDVGTALWVVMGTLGLVLLIACANVANLFLVRTETRRQELAIRAALGAGWGRITLEMLVECMTLGVLGGALGLGLAYAALRVLVAKGPDTLPRLHEIRIDPLVLVFALGVSLLSGALFCLIPVLKYAGAGLKYAGDGLAASLGGAGRMIGQGRGHHRARNTLVVVQVALALVLLVGSGLMIRTFQQLRGVEPGFTHPEEIQIVHTSIPETLAKDPERVMRMWSEIRDKIGALPGVNSVGFASAAPLESLLGFRNIQPLYAEDKALQSGQAPLGRELRLTAPGFFGTMGTRLIAGRDLTWTDLYEKRHVAIVSENLAREWWQDPRAALGKRVRESSLAPWREVVGVVENVYDNGMQVKAPEFAYLPALMDRYLVFDHEYVTRQGTFVIRSYGTGTEGLLKEVQQAIWSVNGRQPVFLVTTLKALYDRSMARTSFTLVMLAIAGGMALLLGIVGIYGVIAYVVSQRTREIGIRIALGAQSAVLLQVFVRQGLLLAGAGVALGLAVAVGLTHLMSSLLFGVTALDPLTYGAVSALLLVVSVLASYLPARRAMVIDPVRALRAE